MLYDGTDPVNKKSIEALYGHKYKKNQRFDVRAFAKCILIKVQFIVKLKYTIKFKLGEGRSFQKFYYSYRFMMKARL